MLKKLKLSVAALFVTTVTFAFNPSDPIGHEITQAFPSTVTSGTGPYAAKLTFKNQLGLSEAVPFSVNLSASPSGFFSIGQNTCGQSLNNNDQCSVIVSFNPQSTTANNAQLQVSFGLFAITVPKPGMSVNVRAAGSVTPPAPPSPPPLSQNYLMWSLPATTITYPVYVYKNGSQVAYIPSASAQVFVGTYPTQADGVFNLYYQSGSTWYGCNVGLSSGSVVTAQTTCPGVVINSPHPSTSNVYTIALGTSAWSSASAPSSPTPPSYSARTITFKNSTGYNYIRIQGTCSDAAVCSSGYTATLASGATTDISVGTSALTSGAFYVTGYCTSSSLSECGTFPNGNWIVIGGYNSDNGGHPYAVKVEPTFLAVTNNIPAGSTNIDISAVDGYNIGVKLYPTTSGGQYCTFTVPPEGSNVLGVGLYSSSSPLAHIPNTTALQTLCQNSSQLPSSVSGSAWSLSVLNGSTFVGCMSPCTYATKTYGAGSGEADQFCCAGSYNTPATCDAVSGDSIAANTSTYVDKVYDNFQNVYPYAYGDAGSDYGCPAETSFMADFLPIS